MTVNELQRLHSLVHEAQAAVNRPWAPGETSRPITFFTDHLAEEGWLLGWTLVAALRVKHPDLFTFYGEERLHRAALEFVLGQDDAPSVEDIAAALHADAADQGPWLVQVPLSNVSLDRLWAPLSQLAVLRRAPDADLPETDDMSTYLADSDDARAEFDVFRHLGDKLPAANRVLRFSNGSRVDMGRGVTLISVEDGPAEIAIEAARAKAQYALAAWSILAPPDEWHLLPDLGVWSPHPYIQQRAVYKTLEKDEWIPQQRRQGGSYRHWSPYDLPSNDVLAAPFEAFGRIERRSAQALLSSTAAVHAATRASRLRLSERVRYVRSAIESLCEPAAGGHVRARWEHLAQRFAVWDRVAEARAYDPEAIAALQRRIVNARNISTHGADAALIDLGWTAGDRALKFGKRAMATDLATGALHRDLGPLIFAVGEALRQAWSALRVEDFDDGAFEAMFSPR